MRIPSGGIEREADIGKNRPEASFSSLLHGGTCLEIEPATGRLPEGRRRSFLNRGPNSDIAKVDARVKGRGINCSSSREVPFAAGPYHTVRLSPSTAAPHFGPYSHSGICSDLGIDGAKRTPHSILSRQRIRFYRRNGFDRILLLFDPLRKPA